MKTIDPKAAAAESRALSAADLANWGLPAVAYIKHEDNGGEGGWSIHAADGTPMALAADRDTALAAIVQRAMFPSLVH